MTPKQVREVNELLKEYEKAEELYHKTDTITWFYTYYNGHQADNIKDDDEVEAMRTALRQHRALKAVDLKNQLIARGVEL